MSEGEAANQVSIQPNRNDIALEAVPTREKSEIMSMNGSISSLTDEKEVQATTISDFCDFCQSFAKELSVHPSTWESESRTYETITTVLDLLITADTCPLCSIILSYNPVLSDYLDCYEDSMHWRPIQEFFYVREIDTSKDIVEPIRVSLETHLGNIAFWNLTVPLPDGRESKVRLDINAEPGSFMAETGAVNTISPTTPEYACAQVSSWLNDCLLNHETCMKTLGGERISKDKEPILPKRVISVGDISSPYVQLVEANGMMGYYTTLSHCWGAIDKQPLRTTRNTIDEYLRRIEFDSLPKTFREAVIVTRAIGIKYLWIDSLCIIQDDEEEWEKESKTMGSIYERSQLTIAAADAENSTEGCFIWEKCTRSGVLVPCHSNHEEPVHVLLSCRDNDGIPNDVAESILRGRAWATQEWVISRRIVFFTVRGVEWKCKRIERDAWSAKTNLGEYGDWSNILTRYSRCHLTYKNDRLPALDGLVAEMKKTRNDQYIHGIWRGSLPEQLLWAQERDLDDIDAEEWDIPTLPSWSWASRGSKKVFWANLAPNWRREIRNKDITIIENMLQVKGSLKPCTISKCEVDPCHMVHVKEFFHLGSIFTYCEPSLHYILDAGDKNRYVGMASMDCKTTGELYCMSMMVSYRQDYHWKYYDIIDSDDDESSVGGDSDDEKSVHYYARPDFTSNISPNSAGTSDSGSGSGSNPYSDEPRPNFKGVYPNYKAMFTLAYDFLANEDDQPILSTRETLNSPESSVKPLDKISQDESKPLKTSAVISGGLNNSLEAMNLKSEVSVAEVPSPSLLLSEKGVYICWALILEAIPDKKDTFRRVGMGLITSNSWTEEGRDWKTVNIV